jgi:hypothetical protein
MEPAGLEPATSCLQRVRGLVRCAAACRPSAALGAVPQPGAAAARVNQEATNGGGERSRVLDQEGVPGLCVDRQLESVVRQAIAGRLAATLRWSQPGSNRDLANRPGSTEERRQSGHRNGRARGRVRYPARGARASSGWLSACSGARSRGAHPWGFEPRRRRSGGCCPRARWRIRRRPGIGPQRGWQRRVGRWHHGWQGPSHGFSGWRHGCSDGDCPRTQGS